MFIGLDVPILRLKDIAPAALQRLEPPPEGFFRCFGFPIFRCLYCGNSVCEILLRMLFHWNPSAAFRGFIDGMDQFQGAEAFPACNSDFPAVENRICHVLQLAPVKFAVGDQRTAGILYGGCCAGNRFCHFRFLIKTAARDLVVFQQDGATCAGQFQAFRVSRCAGSACLQITERSVAEAQRDGDRILHFNSVQALCRVCRI